MNQKLKEFKTKLEDYFITNKDKEWVDIEVVNINRMDIKIVTDKEGEISEFQNIISQNIDKLNSIIENLSEKLYLGHLDINSIEEAELFDISKPIRRKGNQVSFADMVDIKSNIGEVCKNEGKINNSRIISFYSYKGGVGRTVALIQTAYLLAKSGKRVLLMDLDIEAPSFYNIFKDIIKTDKGLVDYLYEKLYFDNDISIKDVITKLNLNLKGEIYLISAGVNDFKYVKRLDMLKEKRIYENKLIQKLIKESEEAYEIDYTLIDSRTGINRWGALSLIDIADEVILFAYPNRENIEGLKLIISLIEDCKKITIALSRIDPSPEGLKIAKKLFSDLEIKQQYIPIYYESGIALAEKYPLEDYLKPYKTISDFILEEENNNMTLEYINDNKEDVRKILEYIEESNFENVITDREIKIKEKTNWIIVKYEKDSLNLERIYENDFKNIILINDLKQNKLEKEVKEYFESEKQPYEKRLSALLSYIIKKVEENEKVKDSNLKGISELKGRTYREYIEYFNKISDKDQLTQILSCYLYETSDEENIKVNLILDFKELLYLFKDLIKDGETEEDMLIYIINIVAVVNMKSDICLKLTLDHKYYEEYSDTSNTYNANVLNLSWTNLDKDEAIEDIEEILENTVSSIRDELIESIYYKLISEKKYSKEGSIENSALLGMFEKKGLKKELFKFNKARYKKEFSHAIYGKRIDPDVYSQLISEWIYEKLKENKILNKQYIFKLLKIASRIELDQNNENLKSIIDFSSFKRALEEMLQFE